MRARMRRTHAYRARVTRCDLDYMGSITIDRDLLDAAALLPLEQVAVYNVTQGTRLTTYCIAGTAGGGEIGLTGAAAHLADVGDIVIIAAYGQLASDELPGHQAAVVFVNDHNRITEIATQTPFDNPGM